MNNFGTAALVAVVLALTLGLAITGFASAADSLVPSRPAAAASAGDADREKSTTSVDADKEFRRLGGLGREIIADAVRERDRLCDEGPRREDRRRERRCDGLSP
jgi:hypothetical protein